MFLSRPREILFLSLSRIDLPPSPSSSSTASVLPFCTASRPCACSSTSCSRHCMARTAVAGSRKNEFLYLNMEYHLGIYQKCFNAIPWITQRRDEVEVVVAEIAQPIGILLEDGFSQLVLKHPHTFFLRTPSSFQRLDQHCDTRENLRNFIGNGLTMYLNMPPTGMH